MEISNIKLDSSKYSFVFNVDVDGVYLRWFVSVVYLKNMLMVDECFCLDRHEDFYKNLKRSCKKKIKETIHLKCDELKIMVDFSANEAVIYG